MKTNTNIKKFVAKLTLGTMIVSLINPLSVLAKNTSDNVIYPLKEISKLECRFEDFNTLKSNCKQKLPILHTKDYSKYAKQNGGYNNYTRIYTELWGASYKYGWDVGNGGHIGTDIATAKGTPVYSMANGKVIHAKVDKFLGNMVSIEHKINGKYIVSNYAHLSKMNVSKGQTVKVGAKIGEVGSTGNSTGNHLHFQIDLKTQFHPYYYNYNKCPYSYYKITEQGVCFNELEKNTIDPLLFLETKGAIVDKISTTVTVNSNNSNYKNTNDVDLNIFNRTVYTGYSNFDIKEVQKVLRDLNLYKGSINGDYSTIEKIIINYQVDNNVIKDKTSDGAGWFGPKTRKTIKIDYDKYLLSKNKTSTETVNNKTSIKTKKISRINLKTRAEIEKEEVEGFLRRYNLNFKFVSGNSNIKKNGTSILKLSITDKKGKAFKGNMPGGMTFVVNTEQINIFPKKLFYFTNGKRDIQLSGLKEGNTNLYIKIGSQTVKTIKLKVYKSGQKIYPESSKLYIPNSLVIGEQKAGIVLFKDKSGKNLINLKYGSTFKIKVSDGNKICIKKGRINNIKNIYKSNCSENEFKESIDFKYEDTVAGLLIFNVKASNKNLDIKISNNYNNKIISEKKLYVSNPRGLTDKYAYKKEIVKMLEEGIVDGINKGYFLEKRSLTEKDSLSWIENGLYKIQKNDLDDETKQIIKNNLKEIKNKKIYASGLESISRKEFLNLNYKYLVFEKSNNSIIKYKDIDNTINSKLPSIFDINTTWKDDFGENYFRPNKKITRGEGAFFIAKTLEKSNIKNLALK